MKQTVEEAAMIFTCQGDTYEDYLAREAFKAGAEWQAKRLHLKRIIRDKDGFATDESLDDIFSILPVLIISDKEGCDCITIDDDLGEWRGDIERGVKFKYWMPIPSFDEILEANKDVLQRLKDK